MLATDDQFAAQQAAREAAIVEALAKKEAKAQADNAARIKFLESQLAEKEEAKRRAREEGARDAERMRAEVARYEEEVRACP